jgi:hypothetical protein
MRRFFPADAAAFAAVALAVCACQPSPSTATAPDAGAPLAHATANATSPPSIAAPRVAPPVPAPRPTCRAVSLQGDARAVNDADGGRGPALAIDGEIPEDDWIGLGAGARLAAKDPRTTRETLFLGPGLVRICAGHREESWVSSGAFESESGAGESPGAEEWVVTPLGVLRFSAAKLRVDVHATHASVAVEGGVVFAWIPPDVRSQRVDFADAGETRASSDRGGEGAAADGGSRAGAAWERVAAATLRLSAAGGQAAPDAARAAVDRCDAIAHRAEDLTRALLAPHSAGESESGVPGRARAAADAIADQVSTRELARAACAVAAVRTDALSNDRPSDKRHELEENLRDAERAWTALPVAPRGAPDAAPSRAAP